MSERPRGTKTAETYARLVASEGEIMARVSSGETLARISDDLGVARPIVSAWLQAEPGRAAAYRRAKQCAADALVDEAVVLADDARPEGVELARLRVKQRLWAAGKLSPETYGERSHFDRLATPAGADLDGLFLAAVRAAGKASGR
jgi:hypothetical protein